MRDDFVCVTPDGGIRVRETMLQGDDIVLSDEWKDVLFDFCPSPKDNRVGFNFLQHPAGRALTSNWFVESCIMVVYKEIF